jgi:hypothetical protein
MSTAPNADRFEELPREQTERWDSFPIPAGHGDAVYLPRYLGIQPEHMSYLDAFSDEDAVAEGWAEKRGGSIGYCRIEVRSAGSEKLGVTASLVYKVSSRPFPDAESSKPMLG